VEAVIAGWAAGYAMGILSTVAVVIILVRDDEAAFFGSVFDPQVSRPLIAIPFFVGATIVWTMIGLVLGSAYRVGGFEESAGGLGSPSMSFTLAMVTMGALPTLVGCVIWPRHWKIWLSLGVGFAALFGWAVPHLAGQ
jgi:hypothetical protein